MLLVSRADGDWQLVCGAIHADEKEFAMAHLGHVLDADSSLEDIIDLPEDFEAEREAVGASWTRRLAPPT